MYILSFLENGKLTMVLEGEIDHHKAKEYISAIRAKIELYTPSALELDFHKVTFMDSSGIAVVLNSLRAMKHMGGELSVVDVNDQPMRVFRTSGIDMLVNIKEKDQ